MNRGFEESECELRDEGKGGVKKTRREGQVLPGSNVLIHCSVTYPCALVNNATIYFRTSSQELSMCTEVQAISFCDASRCNYCFIRV